METNSNASYPGFTKPETSHSNKILIKGVITGVLILVMLIPTVFITNLIKERESRQKEVVAEVSKKWATSQTITGPYLVIPYNYATVDANNKPVVLRKQVILLPETINVQGTILPEKRLRSIYTVLLYRSNLKAKGFFKTALPADIDPNDLVYSEAKLCIGFTDFKGIEEKPNLQFNNTSNNLLPGLPDNKIDRAGLSCNVNITREDITKDIPFNFDLKLKGSQQLYFVPLAGNSRFELRSSWADPSFDGNTLPTERRVTKDGFIAKWNFNTANLPFTTLLLDTKIDKQALAFGVSMLQPADQYAKTMRSAKYAILFIGLTFSLFFIIELLQKKPVHPVQYVLVGLALIIFYSLLLSFSELILFNGAYLIAATATVALITLYAKSHFESWKVASVFASVLASLYIFIFILIQLEDTALLVGSVGLFIVLAVVMYASRKINWYHPLLGSAQTNIA